MRPASLRSILLLVAIPAAACGSDPVDTGPTTDPAQLSARPAPPTDPLEPGVHPLNLSDERDGFIYIPEGYEPGTRHPLMVLLHGAGGQASNWEGGAMTLADSLGVVLLAPDSRGVTWDVRFGRFGPDVGFIDAALQETFRHADVDASRIALAGFSDGASYALSLGLSNGDLFTHLIAWSPGFITTGPVQRGDPGIFVSHGTGDAILPINQTSRQLVPVLEGAGYAVVYREFAGVHEIPRTIANEAFAWFLGAEEP